MIEHNLNLRPKSGMNDELISCGCSTGKLGVCRFVVKVSTEFRVKYAEKPPPASAFSWLLKAPYALSKYCGLGNVADTFSMSEAGYLLAGGGQEEVGAVEIVGVVLGVARRVEPPLQPARAAVREVAEAGPRRARDLVL